MADSHSRYNAERNAAKVRMEPFKPCNVEIPESLLARVEAHKQKSGKLKHEIFTKALTQYLDIEDQLELMRKKGLKR